MQRSERQLKDWPVIEEIVRKGKYITLALCRNNEPYIVTLSYGYDSAARCLYFHCANNGLKTEFIKENPNVCCTIIQDRGYMQNECAHAYCSVILRGKIELLKEESDKRKAINVLFNHLEQKPEIMITKMQDMTEQFRNVAIWRLNIEEITGKKGQ